MRRAIVLVHATNEGPGRLAPALERAGLTVEVRELHRGAAVPDAVAEGDVLVVMGGPMGVADLGDVRWPFLAKEIDLLRLGIARDQPVLGICLGAQLIAAAAEARVYPNVDRRGQPRLEVGWAPVDFIGSEREPALAGLKPVETMLHWHGDTFGLPAGAVLLASTPTCPHQAFRLGERIYGLQFHPEVDADMLATWVRDDAEFVSAAHGRGGADKVLKETAKLLPKWHAIGDRLIANVVKELVKG